MRGDYLRMVYLFLSGEMTGHDETESTSGSSSSSSLSA